MSGTPDPQSDDPARLHARERRHRSSTERVATPRTSGLLALVSTLVGVESLVVGTGLVLAGVLAVVTGLVFAVTTSLVGRESPLGDLGASISLPVLVVLFAASAGLPLAGSGAGAGVLSPLVTTMVVFAVFGAATTLTGALGGGVVWRTAVSLFETLSIPVLATVVLFVRDVGLVGELDGALGGLLDGVTDAVLAPTGTSPELAGFTLLVAAASIATAVALPRLPLVQLVHRRNRQRVATWRDSVVSWCWRLGVVAGLALPIVTLVQLAGATDLLFEWSPTVRSFVTDLTTLQPLRWLLFGVVVLATGLGLLVVALRWVAHREAKGVAVDSLPRLTGGVLLTTLALGAGDRVVSLLQGQAPTGVVEIVARLVELSSPAVVVLVLVVALCTAFLGTLLTVSFLGVVGFIPRRSAPAAVAGGALLLGALFAGASGSGTGFVLVPVAAGIVVWDVVSYGATMREELGAGPSTTRPELVHAVASLFVGVGAVVALTVVAGIRVPTAGPTATIVAVLAAVTGVVFITSVLRG
ncbi:DUF7519 family protein [Haloarchaeobius sp. DFWS5]|uniref:DUF7519 family protein n=1 Tax=Haloarchaeobius sp. DFWS5 TaxID=3446114 RepID=UPI003EB9CB5A